MNKLQLQQIRRNFRKDVGDLVTDLFVALDAANTHPTKSTSRRTKKSVSTRKVPRNPLHKTSKRSSSKLQKVTPINKLAIVKLIKKNKTHEVILNKFPMYTKGQIGAIAAHVTMGTY